MDHEAEHIRQQMKQTRTALTAKLETLENQVIGSVHEATCAVTETVATVKEAVQDTVGTLKESVQESVHTVKETLSMPHQVDRHPWVMFAGSVALGFVGRRILLRSRDHSDWSALGRQARRHAPEGPRSTNLSAAPRYAGVPAAQRNGGWLAHLGEQFAPELNKLQGIAIGASVALLRDLVTPSLPPSLSQRVREIMDGMTTKLGGDPVPEPVLASASLPPGNGAHASRVAQ